MIPDQTLEALANGFGHQIVHTNIDQHCFIWGNRSLDTTLPTPHPYLVSLISAFVEMTCL